jgi:hypothetical protein
MIDHGAAASSRQLPPATVLENYVVPVDVMAVNQVQTAYASTVMGIRSQPAKFSG